MIVEVEVEVEASGVALVLAHLYKAHTSSEEGMIQERPFQSFAHTPEPQETAAVVVEVVRQLQWEVVVGWPLVLGLEI